VADPDASDPPTLLWSLDPDLRERRSGSFGEVAELYERYRPGPSPDAVGWLLPRRVEVAVDLGAGTGALTRLVVPVADEVVAVEPDERMRTVLVEQVPAARAVDGRGDSMPLPDRFADAVLASSSWHWMDTVATLDEVARVLKPGGVLGVMWSGPDFAGSFERAYLLHTGQPMPDSAAPGDDGTTSDIGRLIRIFRWRSGTEGVGRSGRRLTIPTGAPFGEPEHRTFARIAAMDADDLIGLLGTRSHFIIMAADQRQRIFDEARRLLDEVLAVAGRATVEMDLRTRAWRTTRLD
jgi:SAM-dependent methyltransferase